MTALLVDDLAQFIRRVDGDNTATPKALGELISNWIDGEGYEVPREDVIAFVERANPDKWVGAGRLAGLIVAEFGLDEEG